MVSELNERPRILIIEDNPVFLEVIKLILTEEKFCIRDFEDGEIALAVMAEWKPDLVLCDLILPTIDGFEVLHRIRTNNHLQDIPFVFISAHDDRISIRKGMNLGAEDFLPKPFTPEELLSTIESRIAKSKKSQTKYFENFHDREILGFDEKELNPDTRIPTEQSMSKDIEELLETSELAVCLAKMISLDRLQGLIGETGCTSIVREAAEKLKILGKVYQGSFNELFIVIRLDSKTDLSNEIQVIVSLLTEPLQTSAGKMRIIFNCGIVKSSHFTKGSSAANRARLAVIEASDKGGNTFHIFNNETSKKTLRDISFAADLEIALNQDQFEVFYQPQIRLLDNKIIGLEALVRLRNSDNNYLSPAEWIPVAERNGLISHIGKQVLKKACNDAKNCFLPIDKEIRIAVNISGRQLDEINFTETVKQLLLETGLPPENLELEITESIAMRDPELSIIQLREISKMGVAIAVDDFGTGYSSLSYLQKLPVSTLKIDRTFIRDSSFNPVSQAIVRNILDMSRNLNLLTIAEGVEEKEQLDFLKVEGCQIVQGFYFARPIPLSEILEFIETWNRKKETLLHVS